MSRLCFPLLLLLAVPAARASYPAETTHSLALHVHGSFSEMYGSMEWHSAKAESLGVDVIWWTDHDWRFGNSRFMKKYDFESATWDAAFLRWAEPDEAWGANVRYWDTDGVSNLFVATAMVDSLAFEGTRSMLMETAGQAGSQFTSGTYEQTTMMFSNRYSLAKRVTLSLALFAEDLDPVDARFVIEVELNDHPDGVKKLRYVFGSMDGEGVTSIAQPFTPGAWNQVTLALTEDAIQHFSTGGIDTLRAEDNSVAMVRAILETRNDTPARVFLDDYRFATDASLVGDVLLDRQRAIGAYYETLYPGVSHYAGTEISNFLAQPHLNGFAPALDLVDYTGHIYSDSIYYAIDQIHAQGGAVSLNHVFGPRFDHQGNPNETPQQQAGRLSWWKQGMVGNRAYGVDVLEVGYRRRGGMDLVHHLDLWDVLNANTVWMTGNGVTDSHGRGEHELIGWGPDGPLSTTNNFVTWLHAETATEAGFVQAMRRGRAYFGDPYRWQGDLDLRTTSGFRMGQVVFTDTDDEDLLVEITNVPVDVQVRLLQIEIREGQGTSYTSVNVLRDEFVSGTVTSGTFDATVALDTTLPSFVRVEVFDGGGEELVYSNPLCFVRSVPALGVPAERIAARLGEARLFLADSFTLESAAFDSVSQVLAIGGSEEPVGLGALSIDPGALGEPTGVIGAAAWSYVGGIVTLSGFSGASSVVQVAWAPTGLDDGGPASDRALRVGPGRPNPFRSGTELDFSLPYAGWVEAEVFDVSGRRARTLVDGARDAGSHRLRWDGLDEQGRPGAAGVYYLRLRFSGETVHRKLVKLRR